MDRDPNQVVLQGEQVGVARVVPNVGRAERVPDKDSFPRLAPQSQSAEVVLHQYHRGLGPFVGRVPTDHASRACVGDPKSLPRGRSWAFPCSLFRYPSPVWPNEVELLHEVDHRPILHTWRVD